MALFDALTLVIKVWGGYSPKYYDGNFLVDFADELFTSTLTNVGIIADSHFAICNGQWQGVRFFTPNVLPEENVDRNTGENAAVLSQKKRQYNDEHKRLRARVESPFGIIKKKFGLLKMPWRESKKQQTALVYAALGIHNYNTKQSALRRRLIQ